jgi:phenylacetic acid degradation operon negative regulatory protein
MLLFGVLDVIEDLAFLATRPGMGQMSRYWGYTETRAAYRAFQRWEMLEYLERVEHGKDVLYRITKTGKALLERKRPSPRHRDRAWDGRWRMVVFDFPETARKARDAFRRTLRAQRLGCLQKSVWISPDSIIPEWKRLLEETELDEWVLLFESAELGPVDDVEIARKVWSLDELSKRYQQFVREHRDLPGQLRRAGPSGIEGELGRSVGRESEKYFGLLAEDPMLPRDLLPQGFAGIQADNLHAAIRVELRHLIRKAGP